MRVNRVLIMSGLRLSHKMRAYPYGNSAEDKLGCIWGFQMLHTASHSLLFAIRSGYNGDGIFSRGKSNAVDSRCIWNLLVSYLFLKDILGIAEALVNGEACDRNT